MSTISFAETSYRVHEAHYQQYARGGKHENVADGWFDNFTVDAWRHQRMYATLDPLIEQFPCAHWLTIGDGRCGSDARHLRSRGRRALATDIATPLLELAHRRGEIDGFARENAERLSFADNSFDIVLCKESYHHFPRPMVALFEMIRVAKTAVVLIEPYDRFFSSPIPERCFNFAKKIGRRLRGDRSDPAKFQFETVGNFIYTISRREMEKVAAGMNLGTVAFKSFNDCFMEGVGEARPVAGDPVFEKIQREIRRLDLLCKLHFRQPRMLTAVLFKSTIEPCLHATLARHGFDLSILPVNPYLPR